MDQFKILYNRYLHNNNPYIDWEKVEILDEISLKHYDEIPFPDNTTVENIGKKICMIKLNGGLGTTMGCTGPKSMLKVKHDLTFMDIILEQNNLTLDTPLVLMNSFYTNDQTEFFLKNNQHKHNIDITTFCQNKFPRIIKDTNQYHESSDNIDYFYPPGHGDLLQSLNDTRVLKKIIDQGIEYLFISNIDNLGGTLDYKIASQLVNSDIDFAIELTPKTELDIKGGTLIKYDGKYKMFEVAQCPPEKLSEFMSIDKFKYFNTNNIWIKVSSITKLLETNYTDSIDLIINPKKLKDGRECIQLEYAIGSMVKFFDKVVCFNVSRDRFIPVKTNNDLELLRSDKYQIDKKTWKLIKSE